MGENKENDEAEFTRDEIEAIERVIFNSIIDEDMDEPLYDDSDILDSLHSMSEFSLIILEKEIEDAFYNANKEIEEKIEDIDSDYMDRTKRAKRAQMVSPYIQPYFAISQEIINELTIELLEEELIEERYRETNKTDAILRNRFDQELREDLLLRTGIVDNSIKSEMTHVRLTRNRLIHDFEKRIIISSTEEIFVEIERCDSIRAELRRAVHGEENLISLPIEDK